MRPSCILPFVTRRKIPSSLSVIPSINNAVARASSNRAHSSMPLPSFDDEKESRIRSETSQASANQQLLQKKMPAFQRPSCIEPKKEQAKKQPSTIPTHVTYTGDMTLPITSKLKLTLPNDETPSGSWPLFRLMDEDGHLRIQDNVIPNIVNLYDTKSALHAHRLMIRLTQMDDIFLNAQRQGRISFYMSCRGEEAIHIGAAAALSLKDVILAQYREAGVLMYRGFTLDQFADQCFSNKNDLGRGRQMPVHYGSRALNFHTISSPLGTQLPQAVGVGYRLKMENERQEQESKKGCAVAFFGDGSASTGDFHTACNFAATLEVPSIFFCRNNGFAISTSVEEQYRGDGIVSRAPGYGMAAIRVDGNDLFAVNAVMKVARRYAIEHSKPVMVEAMTYRQSHHSTSDDSTRYRDVKEINRWASDGDPVNRFNNFLDNAKWQGGMDGENVELYIKRVRDEERFAVLRAMEQAEKKQDPDLSTMFEDVYHEKPHHLKRQEKELLEHVKRNKEYYAAGSH